MDHLSGLVFRRPQATLTADLWSIFAPPFSAQESNGPSTGNEASWAVLRLAAEPVRAGIRPFGGSETSDVRPVGRVPPSSQKLL